MSYNNLLTYVFTLSTAILLINIYLKKSIYIEPNFNFKNSARIALALFAEQGGH